MAALLQVTKAMRDAGTTAGAKGWVPIRVMPRLIGALAVYNFMVIS